jgi:hypothetical protein
MRTPLPFLIIAALASGCSLVPHKGFVEVAHVSHPLAGEPFDAEEDSFNMIGLGWAWQDSDGVAYIRHSLGYKLGGRDAFGFQGPELVYKVSVGAEFDLRRK